MSETVLTIVWRITAVAIGVCAAGFAVVCGRSLWKGARNGVEDPVYGPFDDYEYINGEWIDPNWSRGFNKKPTDESDPEFRFHDRAETVSN